MFLICSSLCFDSCFHWGIPKLNTLLVGPTPWFVGQQNPLLWLTRFLLDDTLKVNFSETHVGVERPFLDRSICEQLGGGS